MTFMYFLIIPLRKRCLPFSPTASCSPTAPATRRTCVRVYRSCVRKLYDSGLPIFGICLGHQLTGPGHGREDRQAGLRPPRRQPSGQRAGRPAVCTSPARTTAMHGQGRYHCPLTRTGQLSLTSTTAPCEGVTYRAAPAFTRCSSIPRPAPDPQDTEYPVRPLY